MKSLTIRLPSAPVGSRLAALVALLVVVPALPVHATAPMQARDTIRKVAPKPKPSAAKKAVAKVVDTLATVGAAKGVDALLGDKANGIGQMLGGPTQPCGPGAGLLPGAATAGTKLVGIAKEAAEGEAAGTPCPPSSSMANTMMMATPLGMAVTAAPLAAAGASAAAKGVKKLIGKGPVTAMGLLKEVQGKGHLALRGVHFVAHTEILDDGYEESLSALAEALAQVPGPFALYVEPEADKGDEPDLELAQKRVALIWATLVAAGVPESVFVAGVMVPASLVQDRKPAKPGDADVEVWKVARVEPAIAAAAPSNLWVNYDFVPGSRVIYFADYLDDQVGNFPKRLVFKNGNMDVVELDGQRYLRVTGSSTLTIPLPETLPAKFTIEIDVINRRALAGAAFRLQGGVAWNNTAKTSTVEWGSDGVGLSGGEGTVALGNNEANRARYQAKPSQLRILGDGQYLKVYLDEKRYANIPNANFERSKGLTLSAEGRGEENPVYIGRIRVAASDKSIYDALAAKGRVATQGILFDSGSDLIRLESAPTLKEIAAMLSDHPDFKLMVEGHTDGVGNPTANLALSEARARAVVAALVGQHGIAADRLQSKGFGSSKPVAKNDTAEGRQNNRRVELVKN